jgi:purine-cytosine permease-like protein
MQERTTALNPLNLISWLFGLIVLTIGVLNMALVHPVPGIVFLMLSLIYFPSATAFIERKAGFSIPRVVKIILGIIIIQFTLGVSDLGDIIDDWLD